MKNPGTLLMLLALLLSSCSRDIEIRQGNANVTPEQATSVIGLDADAVREVLGPPHSRWQLDGQVWVYYFKLSKKGVDENFTAQVVFGSDKLVDDVQISGKIESQPSGK